ncbi:Putative adenylate kinase [uncultured archaeon]|nr:Putative adenylate kinase [uncultured archaeon]
MTVILVTGVPGTGKGTVSAGLAKRGFSVIAANSLVGQLHLWSRKENGSKVADLAALRRELLKAISLARKFRVDTVIEGHLLCEMRLPADACIVLRTDPDILRKRLEKRRYPKAKLEGNIEAELVDYCTQLSERNLKGACPVYEVSTSGPIRSSVRDAAAIIDGKGGRFRSGWVDWSGRIGRGAGKRRV